MIFNVEREKNGMQTLDWTKAHRMKSYMKIHKRELKP